MHLIPFVILAAALLTRAAVADSFVKNTADTSTTLGISVVSSTSLYKNLPYEIFDCKVWQANPQARYVRLDLYFDQPTLLGGVEITLDKPYTNSVTLYLNDLDMVLHAMPVNGKAVFTINYREKITSVKFNFDVNQAIAVKEIVLLDLFGMPLKINASHAVPGGAVASSTLAPQRFYNALKLFDSKLESGWASNKKRSGDSIIFAFNSPQTITGLKIWNGYQRSGVHYRANSRIKTIRLEDGHGYSQTIPVGDTMGAQTIILSQKFSGKHLVLLIVESYPGEKYDDLVISELRFLNENRSFFIDPLEAMLTETDYNQRQFSKGNFTALLDGQISEYVCGDYDGYMNIRLRSDGSLYLEGMSPHGSRANKYFAIGNYEVGNVSDSAIDLRLFGYIVTEKGAGSLEGGDCGGYLYTYKSGSKKIFTQHISVHHHDVDTIDGCVTPERKFFQIKKPEKERNIDFPAEIYKAWGGIDKID